MGTNKKIFLLEDEIDLNEMIAIELESKGYETITIYNPKTFIKTFSETKPDLLITDLRLPGIHGTEIINLVKNIDVFYPPIIVITAYTDISLPALYNLGAENIIYKPFQLRQLTSTIERLCTPIQERLQSNIENYEEFTGWIRKINIEKIYDVNFGRGGFSFLSEERMEINEVIEFEVIFHEKKNEILAGTGILRWKTSSLLSKNEKIVNKYGVEIVYLDDTNREIFISYVYNNKITPYIPYTEN